MDTRNLPLADDGRYEGASALIVLGGEPVEDGVRRLVPSHVVVIAADSGVDQAHRLGLDVDVAIGDFDSVTAVGLDRARRRGAQISRHPMAKDATDFELALEAALQLGVASAAVVGGEGGRLDHLIANALVMASPRYGALALSAVGSDGARLHVVRGSTRLTGDPGELVSLLAVNGPASGITTSGLLYALSDAVLEPGSSRGVSNQLVSADATVSVGEGVLLVILPGPGHRAALPPEPPHEGPR
jgi:thiamine pyrophosphokinase